VKTCRRAVKGENGRAGREWQAKNEYYRSEVRNEVDRMILGIGIDVVEIERIRSALGRSGFAERVFTAAERE
jgi:ADP-dependent phosphofructokinase/glucokinase